MKVCTIRWISLPVTCWLMLHCCTLRDICLAGAIEFIKTHYANCSTTNIILMRIRSCAFIKKIYENACMGDVSIMITLNEEVSVKILMRLIRYCVIILFYFSFFFFNSIYINIVQSCLCDWWLIARVLWFIVHLADFSFYTILSSQFLLYYVILFWRM